MSGDWTLWNEWGYTDCFESEPNQDLAPEVPEPAHRIGPEILNLVTKLAFLDSSHSCLLLSRHYYVHIYINIKMVMSSCDNNCGRVWNTVREKK